LIRSLFRNDDRRCNLDGNELWRRIRKELLGLSMVFSSTDAE
jgi:hypothetical protein